VLDELIPSREDKSLPGAGALEIGSYVLERLGYARALVAEGLADLDQRAAEAGVEDYAALPAEGRTPLLNEVAAARPGFLESLIFHTYTGYYHDPRVLEALGMEPRPPYPKGYELETGDLSLLDAVRARPRLYRNV
jgi:hypothetical protein